MKIKNSHLTAISLFLLFLYLLSFSSIFDFDRREKISTALLNPKYREQVKRIELSSGGQSLTLVKKDDFWLVDGKVPASSLQVKKLLDSLSSVKELYRVSKKNLSDADYGFEDNPFTISCFYDGKESLLIFGKEDFSKNFRYLKTPDNPSVYQISSYLEGFLSLSPQLWQDMEIISCNIEKNISKNDIQRIIFTDLSSERKVKTIKPLDSAFSSYADLILSLRHAGSLDDNEGLFSDKVFEIILELGNRDEIIISAFDKPAGSGGSEADFILLKVFYKDKNFTSSVRISRWTMEKLRF